MGKNFWTVLGLPVLGGLAVAGCLWAFWPPASESKYEAPSRPKQRQSAAEPEKKAERLTWPQWQPRSEEDRTVEKFLQARKDNAKKSLRFLPPAPKLDDKTAVSEAEGDAIQADYYLRHVRLIVEVHPGEPKQGGWLDTPKRYTLATRFEGAAPDVRTKNGNKVEPPTHLFMINPDLVVEVRDGKLHALRAEMHRD